MATIIDSLIVTLGLDATGFKKGEREVAAGQGRITKNAVAGAAAVDNAEKKLSAAQKARAKEMDARARQVAAGFAKLRNEALGLLAVFTAGSGLKSFVTNTINTAANLGLISANLGKTTEKLQAWQRASERAGGSQNGMVAQLKESAAEIAALQNGLGPSESMQWFLRMGGAAEDLKDGNTYLLARADLIKKIFDSGDVAKSSLMASKMGISEDQYNFIKLGSKAMLDLVAAQEKNSAISEKDAKAALVLRNRWLDFTQAIEATSTRVLVSLIPAFERLMAWLQKVAEWVDDNRDELATWIDDAVKKIIPLLQSLGRALGELDWAGIGRDIRVVATMVGYVADALRLVLDYVTKLGQAGAFKFIGATPWEKLKMIMGGVNDAATVKPGGTPAAVVPQATAAGGTGGVVAQLMALGWSQAQAVGLAANFVAESNLNPAAVGDGGKAYGIGQWHPNRQAAFKEKYGKDIQGSTLAEQVAFAHYELTAGGERGAGFKLSNATSASQAADIVSRHYERPADTAGEAAKRAQMAASIYASMQTANAVAAARMPAKAASSGAGGATGSWGAGNVNNDIRIGTIEVNTQATDAKGVAKEIGPAITRHSFVAQANTGLN